MVLYHLKSDEDLRETLNKIIEDGLSGNIEDSKTWFFSFDSCVRAIRDRVWDRFYADKKHGFQKERKKCNKPR